MTASCVISTITSPGSVKELTAPTLCESYFKSPPYGVNTRGLIPFLAKGSRNRTFCFCAGEAAFDSAPSADPAAPDSSKGRGSAGCELLYVVFGVWGNELKGNTPEVGAEGWPMLKVESPHGQPLFSGVASTRANSFATAVSSTALNGECKVLSAGTVKWPRASL